MGRVGRVRCLSGLRCGSLPWPMAAAVRVLHPPDPKGTGTRRSMSSSPSGTRPARMSPSSRSDPPDCLAGSGTHSRAGLRLAHPALAPPRGLACYGCASSGAGQFPRQPPRTRLTSKTDPESFAARTFAALGGVHCPDIRTSCPTPLTLSSPRNKPTASSMLWAVLALGKHTPDQPFRELPFVADLNRAIFKGQWRE